jgi:hypothetical protein
MQYLVATLAAVAVYLYCYRDIVRAQRIICQIKAQMDDKTFWDKLDQLGHRITQIEIKLARIEARMAMIFAGIGVGIQIVFKVMWP